jgi:ribosomal protein S6--L-glutamate ligase
MKKLAVIGIPDGWSSKELAEAAAKLTGGGPLLIDMADVRLDLVKNTVFAGDLDMSELDGVLVKKIGAQYSPDLLDRLEMLRIVEQRGVRFFSAPEKIIRVLDRLSCTVTLRMHDIPMPDTAVTESVDEALIALDAFGEAVFKPLYSTKARGMTVIKAGDRAAVEAYKAENTVMYIQKKLDMPDRDLGIVFLGGEYLTTYARVKGEGAWNTTTASGGKYQPFEPAQEIIDLAHKAQEPFGLDFTCVDVVLTAEGPFVFEVSAFGGFRGIRDASGMDAAALYAEYAMQQIGA